MHTPHDEAQFRPIDRSRRAFLGTAGGLALGFTIVPRHVLGGRLRRAERASQRCRQSASAAWAAATLPPSAASAPTSSPSATSTTSVRPALFKAFPKARRYKDFRKMLDKEAAQIDAVTVGTPDHIHAIAAMAAIRAGKHVYCQKPLTHTLRRVPRADEGRACRPASPPRWVTRDTPPKVPG